jgi:tRNA pseudouridine38-40 synthase
MRYFFHIGFNGYRYRGWQRQPVALSVQQIFETTLTSIFKVPVTAMGCGRTDAQVHASQFFFHADINYEGQFDLLFRINKLLPADIAVFEIIRVEENQHARFDAIQRTYDYFIHTYKDPFLSQVSALYPDKDLDLVKMKQAVALLPQYNDYRAFCKTPNDHRTTVCKVVSATLFSSAAGDRLRFQISADRFLKKMIRILVGKLLVIGKGKLSIDEFESYLVTKQTPAIFEPAHPQGLYLSKVIYPYLDIEPRVDFCYQNKVSKWQVI